MESLKAGDAAADQGLRKEWGGAAPQHARSTVAEHRLIGEWATGAHPEAAMLAVVVRHCRAVPGSRIALRCGDRVLRYGDLFASGGHCLTPRVPPAVGTQTAGPGAAGEQRSELDGFLAACANVLTSHQRTLSVDGVSLGREAFEVALADRFATATDRRMSWCDPAARHSDIRLLALPLSEPQLIADALAAWSVGATVILAPEPAGLAQLLVEHKVTHVVASANLPQVVVSAGVAALPQVQRWDLVGAARAELAEAVRTLSPRSMNTCAYHSPAYLGPVARGGLDAPGWMRPIPGATTVVLDSERRPVRPGVVGELYIGGYALVERLRKDADNQWFCDNPFAPGQRLYQTGDKARWESHGRLIIENPAAV